MRNMKLLGNIIFLLLFIFIIGCAKVDILGRNLEIAKNHCNSMCKKHFGTSEFVIMSYGDNDENLQKEVYKADKINCHCCLGAKSFSVDLMFTSGHWRNRRDNSDICKHNLGL